MSKYVVESGSSSSSATSKRPYDAMVYKDTDSGYTIAVDSNGNVIKRVLSSLNTDDVAIQAAIDYGNNVYVLNGIYNTSDLINFNEDSFFVGESKNKTVFNHGSSSGFVVNSNNVTLQNFKVIGDGTAYVPNWHGQKGSIFVSKGNIYIKNILFTVTGTSATGCLVIYPINEEIGNIRISDCEAIDCARIGFLNNGHDVLSILNEITYINCRSINCGKDSRVNDWVVGFDVWEGDVGSTIKNATYINCYAEGSWESGFHMEYAGTKENVKIIGCTSKNNAVKPTASYGCGFCGCNNGVSLIGCYSEGNKYGFDYVGYEATSTEPFICSVITYNNYSRGASFSKVNNGFIEVFSLNDATASVNDRSVGVYGCDNCNFKINSSSSGGYGVEIDEYSGTHNTYCNFDIKVLDCSGGTGGNAIIKYVDYSDINIYIKCLNTKYLSLAYLTENKIRVNSYTIGGSYAVLLWRASSLNNILSGEVICSTASGGCSIWTGYNLSDPYSFIVKDMVVGGNSYGFNTDPAGGSGACVLDMNTIIFRNVGISNILDASKLLRYLNKIWFSTITAGNTYVDVTHSLASTPTKVRVTPTTNLGSRSFWVDTKGATTFRINIDSTDVIDHTFDWEAEV